MADDPEALIQQLDATPGDGALRERTARSLAEAGRHAEALKVLTTGLRVLNARTEVVAPSLHREDLRPEVHRCEVEGLVLVRDFVVAQGRVLFFWRPESLDERAESLRDTVRQRIDKRFAVKRKKGRNPRTGLPIEE
jgi:hypothetical protein